MGEPAGTRHLATAGRARAGALLLILVLGACGLLGGDHDRPTADRGEATRLLGGGDATLADGVAARDADLATVYGLGVGADGTVAVAAESGSDFGTWVLDPDSGTVRALTPDSDDPDFSLAAGDPLVRSATVLVPTLHQRELADEIALDVPRQRSAVGPTGGALPEEEQVFGSLAEDDDGALWRTYRVAGTVARVADDDVVVVDLSVEGCPDAEPHGVTTVDGAALVADPGCRALWSIADDGTVTPWGELPDCPDDAVGDRGAVVPADVAHHDDTVVVADLGCRLVWSGPAAGGPLEPLLGGGPGGDADTVADDDLRFDAPVGVEIDADGRVYVLDGTGSDRAGRSLARSPVIWMTGPALV